MSVLKDFRDDGVVYLELRTGPRALEGFSKEDHISLVLDCIEEFGRDTMTTYLILSILRTDTASQAMEVIDLAIKHKHRGIVGIDICGNPEKGDVSIYRDAFAKARQNNLKLTLHFAEVPASSTVEELETLLSYEPNRLGHVINVPDVIKEKIVSRKLGLELCLTCNVNAKLISGGYATHHFSHWRNTGCPVILCTDDVGVFSSPLSNEYLLAAEHFNLDRKALFELCKGAIEAIFGGEEEKMKLRVAVREMEEAEEHQDP
ncbi:hypothetical protein MMC14_008556 [Varicellaria rhodocarpa]|nr:hypothetical protein [Varicellaria rhodocarpa]